MPPCMARNALGLELGSAARLSKRSTSGTGHDTPPLPIIMPTIPKVLHSEGPQFQRFSSPKVLKSENKYINYMCAL